jgi:hypothetical protein
MKLKEALEIGKACELETVGEAIYNIRIHVGNLFVYGEEQREYNELCDDFRLYQHKFGYTLDTPISTIIK